MIPNITLPGRVPSKKNSKIIVCRGNRPNLLPSKAYREWHNNVSKFLYGIKSVDKPLGIRLVFYMPDNRKCDLTNKAESVIDLLVDNKILRDDSWHVLPRVQLECAGVDKLNPRVHIYIGEYDEKLTISDQEE